MAAPLKDIIRMANSAKLRSAKPRALAIPTRSFDGDDVHKKAREKVVRTKNIKLVKDILRHYRFPE